MLPLSAGGNDVVQPVFCGSFRLRASRSGCAWRKDVGLCGAGINEPIPLDDHPDPAGAWVRETRSPPHSRGEDFGWRRRLGYSQCAWARRERKAAETKHLFGRLGEYGYAKYNYERSRKSLAPSQRMVEDWLDATGEPALADAWLVSKCYNPPAIVRGSSGVRTAVVQPSKVSKLSDDSSRGRNRSTPQRWEVDAGLPAVPIYNKQHRLRTPW